MKNINYEKLEISLKKEHKKLKAEAEALGVFPEFVEEFKDAATKFKENYTGNGRYNGFQTKQYKYAIEKSNEFLNQHRTNIVFVDSNAQVYRQASLRF